MRRMRWPGRREDSDRSGGTARRGAPARCGARGTSAARGGAALGLGMLAVAIGLALGGCFGATGRGGTTPKDSSDALRRYPLKTLPTTLVQAGEHTFRVWVVQDFDPNRPGAVSEGLMHVRPHEIEDDQGMLFVFDDERVRGFWMYNTITPLDVAFARMNGRIVKIRQMPPNTLQTFSSIEPAMFALEVKQGTFARLGIREGDVLTVPDEALRVYE